jgi:hypothetical protein
MKKKKPSKTITPAELTKEQRDKCRRIGYGNISLGIRICIDEYKGIIPKGE